MNHSPLPFKTLGPLLGLLAVVLGLSLADFSYLNVGNPSVNQPASVTSLPSTVPSITKFTPTYKTLSGLPQVTWVVSGPTGTRCDIWEGGNNANTFFLPNNSSGSTRILTNPNISRNITLTCTGGGKSVSAYTAIPRDVDVTNSTNGASIKPLSISSLTVTPANRPINTSGALAWSVDCGPLVSGSPQCSCGLSYGSTKDQTVSLSGTKSVTNTTNTATTYRLTCVTADGGKRQSQFLTDTIGTASTPTPTADTRITAFTVLPSPRAYNQSAQLSWTTTNATKCRLSGGSLSNIGVAVQSSIETGSAKYISPLTVAPTATSTVQYTLQCDNGKTGSAFKLDTASTISVTNPKATGSTSDGGTNTTPPPPTNSGGYKNGAHYIVPGSDAYSAYNLSSTKPDTNQVRVRIAEKIPGLAVNSTPQLSPWASLFAQIAEAAAPLTVDVFKDGGANYNLRPILTVPYWTKVKFQWRWAQRTQMDATKDHQLPTNLPGGDWCGYVKDVEKQCAIKYPDTKSKEYDNCLHSKIAWPAQAVAFDSYNLTINRYNNWQLLYDAGFKSCENQFPGGEWEWSPTPEGRTKTVQITSQIWGPNGNTPFNFLPTWLPKVSDSGTQRYVTVQGVKCEKPFSSIRDSLNLGNVTEITEDKFRDWGEKTDTFDHNTTQNGFRCSNTSDPLICNSGDTDNVKEVINGHQCYLSSDFGDFYLGDLTTIYNYLENNSGNILLGTNLVTETVQMMDSLVSRFNSSKVPIELSVAEIGRFQYPGESSLTYGPLGNHALILLDLRKTGGTGVSSIYQIKVLDPNESKVRNSTCRYYTGTNTGSTQKEIFYCDNFGTDTSGNYATEIGAWPRGYNLYSGLFRAFITYCGNKPASKFCQDRGYVNSSQANVSGWLESNYPHIDNYGIPQSPGGICAGWSDFIIRVAYLGNFVGECPRP